MNQKVDMKSTRIITWAMSEAAEGGHESIVRLMLERGANNYNESMAKAACGGHLEIVELMLEKGATDYNWAMTRAAYWGHPEIVKLMLDKGATDYSESVGSIARLLRDRMNVRQKFKAYLGFKFVI